MFKYGFVDKNRNNPHWATVVMLRKKPDDLKQIFMSSNPNAKVFETPTFDEAIAFKFANKPFSMLAWAKTEMEDDDEVCTIHLPLFYRAYACNEARAFV